MDLRSLIFENGVSVETVTKAIKNRNRVKLKYDDGSKHPATGYRVVEPFNYGLSKSGNPVIRVFQAYGDSSGKNKTFTPGWKTLRLDKITDWETTKQVFYSPPHPKYGVYNKNGDKNMSLVYLSAVLPNGDFDEKGNFIPNDEKNYKEIRQNNQTPLNIKDLMGDDYLDKIGANLKGDYWSDFGSKRQSRNKNLSKRDKRWEKSADTRVLHRKGSGNRDLSDIKNPENIKKKVRYSPEELKKMTKNDVFDDEFWNKAEQDIKNIQTKRTYKDEMEDFDFDLDYYD